MKPAAVALVALALLLVAANDSSSTPDAKQNDKPTSQPSKKLSPREARIQLEEATNALEACWRACEACGGTGEKPMKTPPRHANSYNPCRQCGHTGRTLTVSSYELAKVFMRQADAIEGYTAIRRKGRVLEHANESLSIAKRVLMHAPPGPTRETTRKFNASELAVGDLIVCYGAVTRIDAPYAYVSVGAESYRMQIVDKDGNEQPVTTEFIDGSNLSIRITPENLKRTSKGDNHWFFGYIETYEESERDGERFAVATVTTYQPFFDTPYPKVIPPPKKPAQEESEGKPKEKPKQRGDAR